VLVVDDNEDNREIYASSLRHAGFEVEIACDGEEALVVARRFQPEFVIMDLGMPVMDGWAAIRGLRDHPDTKNAYVIVVSGFADSQSRLRATEAGCNEFLAKPCLPRDLTACITRALDR
jgi:CheY-like chemotaxis protein